MEHHLLEELSGVEMGWIIVHGDVIDEDENMLIGMCYERWWWSLVWFEHPDPIFKLLNKILLCIFPIFLQNILNLHKFVPRDIHFDKTTHNQIAICFIDLKDKFRCTAEICSIIFMVGEK